MLEFLGAHRNWFIGAVAIAIWITWLAWYFGPWIWHSWRNRDADYFSKDP